MINVVKDFEKAKFVTHAGKFHADEVLGTVLLEKIFGDVDVIRLPEVDNYNLENKMVYDIGAGKFDHHQFGGNGQRPNGIKFAAFGLLWQEYGRAYLQKLKAENLEDCFMMFDKSFVQFVDAGDNGQIPFENIDMKLVTLSDVIEGFNPNWNENVDPDYKFLQAVDFARAIFENKIEATIAKCSARDFVEDAIDKSENGILFLEKFMPYQEFVLESKNPKAEKIEFVVFKSIRTGYTIRAIPKVLGSFENRKKFPSAWAGLRNEELQKVTGVDTASFCHNARFICVAGTLEDAMDLAKMAVENEENE